MASWRAIVCSTVLAALACGSTHRGPGQSAGTGEGGGDAGLAGAPATDTGGSEGVATAGHGGVGASDGPNCFGATGDAARPSAGVNVIFPASVSYTDAPTLTVRGRAWAPDGVARVEVEGVEATTSDGFASWTAEIPIRDGTSEYYVSFTDEAGEVTEQAAMFKVANRGRVLRRVTAMDFDAEREQLIIADAEYGFVRLDLTDGRVSEMLAAGPAILASDSRIVAIDAARHRALGATSFDELASIDLESGEAATVSGWDASTESVNFSLASGLTIDAEHDRAFVLGSGGIVAVDLISGARTVVVEPGFDDSIDPEGLDDIVYDAVTNPEKPRLLVSNRAGGSIIAIDPMDGSSTPWLAGDQLAPSRMKLDATRGRLLVVDGSPEANVISNQLSNQRQLVAIDLVDQTSQVLSGPDDGAGYLPGAPYALALDEEHDRAYFADRYGGRVAAVDLAKGDRTLLVESDVGAGRSLEDANTLLLWPPAAPNLLLGVEANHGSLLGIELANGDRDELSTITPALSWPKDAVAEPADGGCSGALLALDNSDGSVVRLDLVSGERTLITSPDTAEGPPLGGGNSLGGPGLALDASGGRVLVTNVDGALVAVDLASGARTIMSDAETGDGPSLDGAAGVVWDDSSPSSPRALVGTYEGIVAVEPTTGEREYLVAPAEGAPAFVRRLALSPDGGSLIVLTAVGLFSVDTTTGASVLISGRATWLADIVGTGPLFESTSSLQVDFSRSVAYVLDISLMAVVAIDLTTGERILASH